MKILYLTTRDLGNPKTGADVRAKKVQEHLSYYNEVYSVFFSKENSNPLPQDCFALNYPSNKFHVPFSSKYYKVVKDLISKVNFDMIYVSEIGAGTYALLASKIYEIPIVFDDHNVEHELKKSLGNIFEYGYSYFIEKKLCDKAELVVVTSKTDESKLSNWIKNRSFILPNCYDEQIYYFEENETLNDEYIVLFFGNMAYKPNQDAFNIIREIIAPEVENISSDITFHVVGPNSEKISDVYNSNVKIIGFVDSISEYIRKSDVVICPLLEGSGTRFKIIESLACGKQVISTAKGAEGWPDSWQNLLITDTQQFSNKIINTIFESKFNMKELDEYKVYSWGKQIESLNCELKRIAHH